MKFGIFFELSVPRPFTSEMEQQVYHNALEQARVADELGFDYLWAVEHHFLEEYSHCSAPEVFLTACAMATKNIRVGHGAVVCVPEMNHPVRVAERAAVLDIISGGRLDVGTARSSTWTELGGFQANPDDTKIAWDEYVRVLPQMWTRDRFSYQGTCFSMPERAVLPKPMQKPHPPLWVAVTTPGTELDAAERGIGCLGVADVTYAEQEQRTKEYHRRIRSCDPVGAVNDQVSIVSRLFCHEDAQYGTATGLRLTATYGLANSHLFWTREAYPTRAYQSLANLAPRAVQDLGSPGERRRLEGLCVGDPEQVIQAIKGWESIGVDGINFLISELATIPQEQVLASLRLFAREVMPRFKKGEAASPAPPDAVAAVGHAGG
jgi:alkanesulfonate monooxygenase SsuD/methylene tetrahydromethanopterin reductase-like flavin-dependent oxidoreductase (luciferase family)